MPQAEHTQTIHAPLTAVWSFVKDMDNWAPFITGYQRHEKISEADSLWFLKGELGGLTRVAEFKVHIEKWDDVTGHVIFSMQGVNEPVTGAGSFHAMSVSQPAGLNGLQPIVQPPKSFFFRLRDRLVRALFARLFGKPADVTPELGAIPVNHLGETAVMFKLNLTASGMAGMVLNALLTPMMKPVAEDLAGKLAAAIEGRAG